MEMHLCVQGICVWFATHEISSNEMSEINGNVAQDDLDDLEVLYSEHGNLDWQNLKRSATLVEILSKNISLSIHFL